MIHRTRDGGHTVYVNGLLVALGGPHATIKWQRGQRMGPGAGQSQQTFDIGIGGSKLCSSSNPSRNGLDLNKMPGVQRNNKMKWA